MAQRDKFARPFRCQYPGNPCGGQSVTFCQPAGADQRNHFSGGVHDTGRGGGSRGSGFIRDVNHPRGAVIVKMGQTMLRPVGHVIY